MWNPIDRTPVPASLAACLFVCRVGRAVPHACPLPPSLPRWGPRQGCTLALERPSLADLPALLGDWGCSLRLLGLGFRCKLRGSQCRPEQGWVTGGGPRGRRWPPPAFTLFLPVCGACSPSPAETPRLPSPSPLHSCSGRSPPEPSAPLCPWGGVPLRACPPPSLSAVSGSPTPGTASRQKPPPSTEGPGCSPKRPGFTVSPKTPRARCMRFYGGGGGYCPSPPSGSTGHVVVRPERG